MQIALARKIPAFGTLLGNEPFRCHLERSGKSPAMLIALWRILTDSVGENSPQRPIRHLCW